MDKGEALEIVCKYKSLVKEHFDVDSMYLYGSYAKNTNTEESDIDVAVVVKSLEGDFFSTHPLLWKLRRQVDDRIEPILIDLSTDTSGFLDEIKRYGIEIG